jgi:hypothetical protein
MLLALQGGIKIEAKTQFLMDKIIEKNEFELSDIEVVLRSPTRCISVKYDGIHEEQISYLLANHSFPWRP